MTQSQVRRPRGIVYVNGKPVSFIGATVESKSHFSADTWQVRLEAWNQPEGYGMSWWDSIDKAYVEIQYGFLEQAADVSSSPSSLTSLVYGQADDVTIDPLSADSLIITGRDLSAQLIDQKTTNKYPDHVASWIATTVAQEFGLTPQVTATTTPVGQYYNQSYAHIARDMPYWDLLAFLADQEGFDLYVTGSTLYFGPPQADSDKNPIIVSVQRDGKSIRSSVERLRLHRSLTISKDIVVTVISHNVQSGSVRAIAQRKGGKGGKSAGSTLNYTIRRFGLSQAQAQALAEKVLGDVTRFERTFELTMEGDPTKTVRNRVVVQGTQTAFDQSYYIENMTRTLDFDGGFSMSVRGKNITAQSEES